MKAAALSSFGPPEVLELAEVPTPEAGPGQVRIKVEAAGVLPLDCKIRSGWNPRGVEYTFPVILGNEYAGTIDQVGDGVTGAGVGDEVMGFTTMHSYAEYVVVTPDEFVAKPAGMPWEIAGGLSGNGQGAHMALTELGVGPGDTVLVNAAAGGLGTLSVQLARAWGATTVIGTASEANHDYLRSIGAIPVAYGDGLVERIREVAPDGVDAALDGAGPEALRASVEVTKDKNRVLTMISFAEAEKLGLRDWAGVRTTERLAELVALHEQGALAVHVRAGYPLEKAADAHRDVGSGHGRGKVVLTVG